NKSLRPVDRTFLEFGGFRDTVVLHPLPRVDEIDYAIDTDPRGLYFQQAALGVPIRMALVSFLLGRENMKAEPPTPPPLVELLPGERCRHRGCIVNTEPQYLEERVRIDPKGLRRCAFCDQGLAVLG
ncbi:MAG: hypothetical protein KDB53_15700, partial [Planctomycetes bacterium]|nr:hypothetical protein [Planctomycetota bacterium]